MHQDESIPGCGQPRLNFDVLRLVCNYLAEVSDVLSFALTCSALTEDAFRRRLSMSPIALLNGESVRAFHTFIFSNKTARARYIYGLKLPGPYTFEVQVMDPSIFKFIDDCLVALLEAAVHIRYLCFPTSINDPVFDAAMKLTTLRELHAVSEVYQGPLRVRLPALRSPLRSLCIEESDVTGDNISASFLHRHLSYVAPTLEAIDLDFFQLDILPSSITTRFPAVRSLKFRADHISFSFHPMAILLRLFPNLNDTLVLGPFSTIFTADEFLALRARSEEEQKAHAWPGLARLICDAEWAFVYALRCPVHRMDVHLPRSSGKRHLAETLRGNSPRHLHLSLRLAFGEGLGALDGLFPLEAADRLTHLVILVGFMARSKWRAHLKCKRIPWNRFFNRIVDYMKHLRLTHLRVVFDCTVLQGVPNSLPKGGLDLVNAACGPDLQPVTARFMDTMPTLNYLFLDARSRTYAVPSRNQWQVDEDQTPCVTSLTSNAWRFIHHDDSGLPPSGRKSPGSWTELGGGEAAELERIADQEGLRLSRRGEVRQWRDSDMEY